VFSDEYHVKRIALIDADYLAYHTAAWAHAHQQDMSEIHDRVCDAVDLWLDRACASDAIMVFSCDRDENFRRDFFPLYKAHRTGAAPLMLDDTKDLLRGLGFRCASRPRVEADDLIGIMMTNGRVENPVCISRDKDLRQIPGWHLNPFEEDFPVFVSEQQADRLFFSQWLSGDPTDGFPGIRGVGPKRAEALLDPENPQNWLSNVCSEYARAGHTVADAEAQAVCARILRAGDWNPAEQAPRPYRLPEAHQWGPPR